MQNGLQVFKFGGASIKDADAIRNVADILEGFKGLPLVVVISAMGKTTNALEEVVKKYQAHQPVEAQEALYAIKDAHLSVALELFDDSSLPSDLADQLNDLMVPVEWQIEDEPSDNPDFDYDQIVSLGELLSTRIVAAYLNQRGIKTHWLDARDAILTDDIYREGWVQWPETESRIKSLVPEHIKAGELVLTQGFIGSTTELHTTTLGREGSDYTAAIFSYCLDADRMSIWKDVPGVLTADPRKFKNVSKLDRLSYREAIEMTYYGAKVIHPKTIKPLQNKSIPLHVRSFIEPEGEGTIISDALEDEAYPAMVAVEDRQALVHVSTRDFSFVAEQHIKEFFDLIAELRLQVNMIQNTAIAFNVVFNDVDDKVDQFCARLKAKYATVTDRELQLITIRHYTNETVDSLKKGKLVLLEGRLPKTVQMVVKEQPVLVRK
ncbi:MAG: aspartate kinase [Bacteroidota bacterium]